MGMTLSQKILARVSGREHPRRGGDGPADVFELIDLVMPHYFATLQVARHRQDPHFPERCIVFADHEVPSGFRRRAGPEEGPAAADEGLRHHSVLRRGPPRHQPPGDRRVAQRGGAKRREHPDAFRFFPSCPQKCWFDWRTASRSKVSKPASTQTGKSSLPSTNRKGVDNPRWGSPTEVDSANLYGIQRHPRRSRDASAGEIDRVELLPV